MDDLTTDALSEECLAARRVINNQFEDAKFRVESRAQDFSYELERRLSDVK